MPPHAWDGFREQTGKSDKTSPAEAHLKNCPFGVVPLLHSVRELTILDSKTVRVYTDVGYIVDCRK
jgi:hypothetical protein